MLEYKGIKHEKEQEREPSQSMQFHANQGENEVKGLKIR